MFDHIKTEHPGLDPVLATGLQDETRRRARQDIKNAAARHHEGKCDPVIGGAADADHIRHGQADLTSRQAGKYDDEILQKQNRHQGGEPKIRSRQTQCRQRQYHPAHITLTWNSSNDTSCSTSGGSPADGWSGSEPVSGSDSSLTESSPGAYTYVIQCTGNGETANAQTVVTFVDAASASSGSSHGGGSLGLAGLGALALLTSLRFRQEYIRRRKQSAA